MIVFENVENVEFIFYYHNDYKYDTIQGEKTIWNKQLNIKK